MVLNYSLPTSWDIEKYTLNQLLWKHLLVCRFWREFFVWRDNGPDVPRAIIIRKENCTQQCWSVCDNKNVMYHNPCSGYDADICCLMYRRPCSLHISVCPLLSQRALKVWKHCFISKTIIFVKTQCSSEFFKDIFFHFIVALNCSKLCSLILS